MGWASGASLYSEVIHLALFHIPDVNAREEFHYDLIDAFEGEDWDTQDECIGLDPAFDRALERRQASD